MKKLFKILIIFFIIISFYIFQNEILLWVGNIYTSIISDVKAPNTNPLKEKIKTEIQSKVDLPGALRVIDNIVNGSIKLSNAGVITYTNKYRKENGDLAELTENKTLDLSAEKKLKDMFAKQYFEHVSPSGVDISKLADEAGYEYILIGENLAMGNFKDDKALVDAWMASPGHRANILNKNYTEIGVAVGKGVFEDRNVWMAVQHFGTPQSSCPLIDKVLYGKITINKNKLKEMEDDLVTRRNMINEEIVYEGNTHYEQIDIYNSLLKPYNDLITTTKNEIETYNNEVEAYNNCLKSKQQ